MSFEEKILAGIIVGLVVPLVIYVMKKIIDSFRYKSSKVQIDFPKALPSKKLKFYLRHVRDGKDEIDGRSQIINKDIKIRFNRKGHGVAKVTHSKTLGFQFKCYVDIGSESEQLVFDLLGSNGISDWSYDESSKKRIWFLVPNEAKCTTVDQYENNYFHANRPKA